MLLIDENTAFVSFNLEISPASAEALLETVVGLTQKGTSKLCLMMSTGGGSVAQGLTIYNTLRALPLELITWNVGSVNSIGNVIFLAGARRIASPGSTFMFHGIGVTIASNSRLEERDLIEKLDAVRFHQRLVARVIAERTRITERNAHALFLRSAYISASAAKSRGIVHRLEALTIPRKAKLVQVAIARDRAR